MSARILWFAMEVEGIDKPILLSWADHALTRYKWRMGKADGIWRYGDRRVRLSHAIVGRPPAGCYVIHRNGDTWDFRRENLLTVSKATWIEHMRRIGIERTLHLRKKPLGPSPLAPPAARTTARFG